MRVCACACALVRLCWPERAFVCLLRPVGTATRLERLAAVWRRPHAAERRPEWARLRACRRVAPVPFRRPLDGAPRQLRACRVLSRPCSRSARVRTIGVLSRRPVDRLVGWRTLSSALRAAQAASFLSTTSVKCAPPPADTLPIGTVSVSAAIDGGVRNAPLARLAPCEVSERVTWTCADGLAGGYWIWRRGALLGSRVSDVRRVVTSR